MRGWWGVIEVPILVYHPPPPSNSPPSSGREEGTEDPKPSSILNPNAQPLTSTLHPIPYNATSQNCASVAWSPAQIANLGLRSNLVISVAQS